MTKAQFRKALKSAKIEIHQTRITCFDDPMYKLGMSLQWPDGKFAYDGATFEFEAQANCKPYPREDREQEPYTRDSIRKIADLYGAPCGGYYGMEIKTKMAFPQKEHKDNAEQNEALRSLVADTITGANLTYVYPDCEVSRVIDALVRLGARVDVSEIDGTNRGDYLRAMRAQERAADEARKAWDAGERADN